MLPSIRQLSPLTWLILFACLAACGGGGGGSPSSGGPPPAGSQATTLIGTMSDPIDGTRVCVAGTSFWTFGSTFYPIVKNLIEQSIASGLIYLNSSARDFQNPELRPYLDKYLRVTAGYDSVERVKLMKLLWDAIGSEFGGRGELYEINWAGSTEETRISTLGIAQAIGLADQMKRFVDSCLGEYDLDGWTVPDLLNPDDVSWLPKR